MPVGGYGPALGPGKGYPGNLTLYVTVTCMVAAMGGLIFGYDIGISGGVTSMDSFLKKFFPNVYNKETADNSTNQYCKFNSQKLTMFTSSLYLAALTSSIVASTVTRTFGRKLSMLFGGVLFCAGALINGFAQHVWMLILGRILLGFGIGFANQSVPLYLSEMAPYKYRGTLNICFELLNTIGILVANVLNYSFAKIKGGWGWRLSLGGAVVPALIITIGALVLPETPNSMIERGKAAEAKAKLKQIRGIDDVEEEFLDLVAASEESKKVEHPWANLLQKKYRPHLTMAIMIPCFQQLTGINVIMYVNVGGTLVSIYVVVVAACIASKFGIHGEPGDLPKWYAIVVIFLDMLCHFKFGLFLFFAFWVVVMTIFIFFFLPETKNIPIEEMVIVWKEHWFWSKYMVDVDYPAGKGAGKGEGNGLHEPKNV
ncbi:hypothetical protein C3L33_06339, partial [Rhododendron williamsianum]